MDLEASNIRSWAKSAGMSRIALLSFTAGGMAALASLLLSLPLDIAIYIWLTFAPLPPAIAYRTIKAYDDEVESRAPELFYDLSEQVKASGSIVRALKRVSRHSYGPMSDEVTRVLSEVEDEGMDLASSFQSMARRVENRYINRAVPVIKEAMTSSSSIDGILRIISEEGRLSLSLKKERRSGISSSISVIYLTAFIFLAVVSLCLTSFMPLSAELKAMSGDVQAIPIHDASMPYYILSISVALCSGLTIGEMRDSTIFGGFLDAAILLTVTFLVYQAIVFPGFNLLEAYGL
jgi:pilus assembly protein TadC